MKEIPANSIKNFIDGNAEMMQKDERTRPTQMGFNYATCLHYAALLGDLYLICTEKSNTP